MTSTVPFVTLDREHASLADELREAFERVLASSAFILGEEVEAFERDFAAFCETDHCVGVASGTAALTLALQAVGVGPGDEVVVPAHTYIASALGVVHAGATPVFCDVDDATGLMDPASAAEAVGPRTAALVPVHLYGQACDMDAICALAARHGLAVVEDAAQAHGARWRGRSAGSMATAAAFSFYPSKNLGALGDGGAVCTADPRVADRVRRLRNLGQRAKGEHVVLGANERLDGLQAAFLSVKLRRLRDGNARRRVLAAGYRELLGDAVTPLAERRESPCVFHLFPVRCRERERLADVLAAAGIACGVHYSPAVPDQPPFTGACTAGDVPRARAWAAEELSLPMSPELTRGEIERVARAVIACDRAAAAPSPS